MQLKSSAFRAGGAIPAQYTCEGEDISPEFSWTDIPAGADRREHAKGREARRNRAPGEERQWQNWIHGAVSAIGDPSLHCQALRTRHRT